MKLLILSFLVASASIFWYYNVEIVDFFKPEPCEDVRKFTYWPIVLNPWNQNDNLGTMKKILDRIGFKMVNGSEEPWDLMWSIEFPFDKFSHLLKNLKMSQFQKINHIPGAPHFSNKQHLSTTTNSTYILPAFQLPKDEEKFMKFLHQNPDKNFVEKFFDNRGVQLVLRETLQNGYQSDEKFLQVFLDNPLLIDGHQFDMGVYVLISSIDPLVIYRFKSECLFRFCPEPYHPFDPKNTKKYVIDDDKLHAWEMPTFQRLEGRFEFFHADIFRKYLKDNGHDVEKVWKQVDDAISSVILSKHKELVSMVKENCKLYGCTNNNFFELFRFDFIIDDALKLYLLEINMSPNLTPSKDEYLRNGIQYDQVVYETLRLIGAEGFLEFREDVGIHTYPQNIAVDFNECSQCEDDCESESCTLCIPCLNEDLKDYFHRFYREHQRRGSFKRIFPTIEAVDDETLAKLPELTQKTVLWFEAKCFSDEEWC